MEQEKAAKVYTALNRAEGMMIQRLEELGRLENSSVATLVDEINRRFEILQEKGMTVADRNRGKGEMCRVKVFGSSIYFLAAGTEREGRI